MENKYLNWLNYFSLKKILIISIVIHLILEYLFPSFYGDQFLQVESFYNFIEGHGLSLSYAHIENLSEVYYEKLNLWPFGFVYLNYPWWLLTKNIFYSVLINNTFAIIIFFCSIYKILVFLDATINDRYKKIVLLFLAIQIMPSRYMGATDLWCLACLTWATYLTIKIINDQTQPTFKNHLCKLILIAVLVSLTISLRFTYWVFIIAIPFIFLVYGFIKDKYFYWLSMISLLFIGILSGLYIYFHYQYFGNIVPSSLPMKDSFQWQALGVYNPIAFNSLFRDSIVRSILLSFLKFPGNNVVIQICFQLINVLLLIAIIKFIINFFWSKKYNFFENLKNGLGVFIITSIILIGINNMGIIYSTLQFGFLNFTSDTYPLGYSAVAEVRYFAPSLILLFILLIMSFLKLKNRIWRSLIGTFIILGFVFAFVINGVFLYSRLVKPLPKVPEYIHYKKNDLDIYQVLKNYNPENTRFFINKYSSLQTYYFARCAHIPIFSNYNLSLPLYSKSSLNIIGLVNATEDIYPEYQKEVLIKNIEPNIDLINIKINNN